MPGVSSGARLCQAAEALPSLPLRLTTIDGQPASAVAASLRGTIAAEFAGPTLQQGLEACKSALIILVGGSSVFPEVTNAATEIVRQFDELMHDMMEKTAEITDTATDTLRAAFVRAAEASSIEEASSSKISRRPNRNWKTTSSRRSRTTSVTSAGTPSVTSGLW